jgi:hypothetical protein
MFEGPLAKRRTEWMRDVTEVLNDLMEKGVVTEADLQENEVFISTVVQAYYLALRNHESEKLEALRNAVRNSALPTCPADDYRQLFLNFVDQCTVTQIRFLRFADDPMAWFERTGTRFPGYKSGDITGVIDAAMPELKDHAKLRDAIWDDLINRGLIERHLDIDSKGPEDTFDRKTTAMGADLVRFIG